MCWNPEFFTLSLQNLFPHRLFVIHYHVTVVIILFILIILSKQEGDTVNKKQNKKVLIKRNLPGNTLHIGALLGKRRLYAVTPGRKTIQDFSNRKSEFQSNYCDYLNQY